jgi:hypothetical protein
MIALSTRCLLALSLLTTFAAADDLQAAPASSVTPSKFKEPHSPYSALTRRRAANSAVTKTASSTDAATVDAINLADWLVRHGHALDWPRYSKGDPAQRAYLAPQAERGRKRVNRSYPSNLNETFSLAR